MFGSLFARGRKENGSLIQKREQDSSGEEGLWSFRSWKRRVSRISFPRWTYEILARAIHQEYIIARMKAGIPADPSLVRWEQVPESLKESNRRQADTIGLKLDRFRCIIDPLRDWDAPVFEFSPEEVEDLARLEHARWLSERQMGGWRFDPLRKDLSRKATPALVPWEQLPEDAKRVTRESIRNLPLSLAEIDSGYAAPVQ
jgi:hypothetical protein